MTELSRRRRYLEIAQRCWTGLVLAGLAWYLWKHGDGLMATLRAIAPANLAGALACILVGKLAAFQLMRGSLLLQAVPVTPWRDNLWVYTSADIAKYLPGGIWAVAGRVVHYRRMGMSAASLSKALLIEHAGLGLSAVVAALPVAVVVLAGQGWLTAASAMLAAAALAGGFVVAWKLSERLDLWAVPGREALRIGLAALLTMLVGWVAMGASFALLLPTDLDLFQWAWAIGTYVIAFLAGMAAVFAPAGAGIREAMLVLTGRFSGFPAAMMLDAAILSRALWFVADLSFFTAVLALKLPRR